MDNIKWITGSLGKAKKSKTTIITDDGQALVTDAESLFSVGDPISHQDVNGYLSDQANGVNGNITRPMVEPLPEYEGPYTITPSQQTQTLSTEGMKATQNIVIEPIPSNYGLITWNGSTLTVS